MVHLQQHDASMPPARVVKLKNNYIVVDASNNPLSQRWSSDEIVGAVERAKIVSRMATRRGREPNPAIAAVANFKITP